MPGEEMMMMRRCWTKMTMTRGSSTSKFIAEYTPRPLFTASQVVGRRRPVVQNPSLCHQTFVFHHRNAARVVGCVIQRGVSGSYLPVRRPRGDGPSGGMGNIRRPSNANSAIWWRAANQGLSWREAEKDPRWFRPRGDGLLPFAGSDTCASQSTS
jgi:hypothetical protein